MTILLLVIVIIMILALVVTCRMYTSHYWLSVTDRGACGVNPKPSMFVIKLKACLYYQVTVFMFRITEYPQEIFRSIGLKYTLNSYSPHCVQDNFAIYLYAQKVALMHIYIFCTGISNEV